MDVGEFGVDMALVAESSHKKISDAAHIAIEVVLGISGEIPNEVRGCAQMEQKKGSQRQAVVMDGANETVVGAYSQRGSGDDGWGQRGKRW